MLEVTYVILYIMAILFLVLAALGGNLLSGPPSPPSTIFLLGAATACTGLVVLLAYAPRIF